MQLAKRTAALVGAPVVAYGLLGIGAAPPATANEVIQRTETFTYTSRLTGEHVSCDIDLSLAFDYETGHATLQMWTYPTGTDQASIDECYDRNLGSLTAKFMDEDGDTLEMNANGAMSRNEDGRIWLTLNVSHVASDLRAEYVAFYRDGCNCVTPTYVIAPK